MLGDVAGLVCQTKKEKKKRKIVGAENTVVRLVGKIGKGNEFCSIFVRFRIPVLVSGEDLSHVFAFIA